MQIAFTKRAIVLAIFLLFLGDFTFFISLSRSSNSSARSFFASTGISIFLTISPPDRLAAFYYDTLSSLTDTINLVSETIKLFCEESESFQDEFEGVKGSSHCPCQTDTSDSHQQDCDTKENADSLQSFNPLLE